MGDDHPQDPAATGDHGPIRADRVPRGSYEAGFLAGLKARGEVKAVEAGWSGDSAGFPPQVTWVLHPNGDLERIGFN